jgi:hypothetical protein
MERTSKRNRTLGAAILALALAGIGLVATLSSDEREGVADTARPAAAGYRSVGSEGRSALDRVGSGSQELNIARSADAASAGSGVKVGRPRRAGSGRSWWMSVRVPSWGRSFAFASVLKPAGTERRVETPSQTLPESCTLGACTDQTVHGREVSTPGSAPRRVSTHAVDVPGRCAGIVCVGAFSIRPLQVSTPGSEGRSVSTPEARVPAACRAARRACMGPTDVPGQTVLVVPASEERQVTEDVAVSVSLEGAGAGFSPHVGESDRRGPYFFPVNVPEVGVIEITLCPDGCASPKTTEGSMQGELRVGVSYGDASRTVSVPLDKEW